MSIARFCVRLYYRESRLGARVPGEGPILLVANHPNGLVDPVVLAGVTTRAIRFLGKAPLFELPILGRLLRGLEVLPVYREQDGADRSRNEGTFEAVFDGLAGGDLVCLFPEGKSHNEPELQRLKTGAARMALGAEARADFQLGVRIVPVGLTYRAKRRFGSSVATWVGTPIELAELKSAHAEDDREAVRRLTTRIASGLREVTVSLDRWEDLPLLELAERILPRDERGHVERLRAFAESVQELRAQGDPRLDPLVERIAAFRLRLAQLRIPVQDLELEYRVTGVLSYALRNLTRLVIGLPLGVIGALLWVLPYRLLPWLTARLTAHRDVFATYQILGGLVLFPLWLLAASLAAYLLAAPWAGIACLLGMPLLGLFALSFQQWRGEVYEDVRVFLLLGFGAELRRRLVKERDSLAEEIARLRKPFRSSTEEASGAADLT